MVAREDPKKKVAVTVLRDGREKTLNVVLGERPQQIGEQNPQQQAPEEQNTSKLGLTVQELTPELARQLGYQNDQGVLIADVDSGSPAEDAGLRRGDLIKEVDRTPVTSIGEFKKALSGLRSGDTTALLIRRGQATVYVAITMP
jgi:serine protease Do